jgi:hypothetical protein
MPIVDHDYRPPRAGREEEVVYTIRSEVSDETLEEVQVYSLAVRARPYNTHIMTLWQGDEAARQDPGNDLVAQSDRMDLEKEPDRKAYMDTVRDVFRDHAVAWFAADLQRLKRTHKSVVLEGRNRNKRSAQDKGGFRRLTGQDEYPALWRSENGYSVEWQSASAFLEPLNNFTLRITEELTLDDGSGVTEKLFTMKGELEGEKVPAFTLTPRQFRGMAWIEEKLGEQARIELPAKKYLVAKAIQLESYRSTDKVHAYKHTGWIQYAPGEWGYMHAGGIITGSSKAARKFKGRVVMSSDYAHRRLPSEKAKADELREAVRASLSLWDLTDDRVMIPLTLAVYRTALGNMEFSIYLEGPTGFGKTTLGVLLSQHFGRLLEPGDHASYNDTPYAVEALSFLLKDQVLLLDDYRGKPAHENILAYITRNAANAQGRRRMGSGGSLPSRPPRALILNTAELLPAKEATESTMARLLVLRMTERLDTSKDAPINEAQRAGASGQLSTAMAGFLRYLAPDYGQIKDTLRAQARRYGYQASAELGDGMHPSTPQMFGDLMVGRDLFLEYAESVGAITDQEVATLMDRSRMAVMSAFSEQGTRLKKITDQVERVRAFLNATLGSGAVSIEDLGFHAPGEALYLRSKDLHEAILAQAQRQGQSFTLSQQAMDESLFESGWLLSTDRDKARNTYSIRKRRPGDAKVIQVLHLKEDFIETRV